MHPPYLHLPRKATMAMALALGGCATPAPETWRVAPLYQLANAGARTDQGYVALARQYEGERRWREARDAWRKAALAAPQDVDTQNALGMAEAGQGLYGKAIAALRRAVALAPQRAQLLNNLGYALLLDGHSEEAKSVLKEALARSPEHPLAKANLARIDQLANHASPPESPSRDAVEEPPLASLGTPGPVLQTLPNLAPLLRRQAGLIETTAPEVQAQSAAEPTAPAEPPRIEIVNGNGVTGMATSLRGWLRARGLAHNPLLRNALPFNTAVTVVHYRAGYLALAQDLADRMPQRVELAPEPGGVQEVEVRLLLGRDLRAVDRRI